MVQIRPARRQDLPALCEVYRQAKAFMIQTGNPTQWVEGYPQSALEEDLQKNRLFLLETEEGEIVAGFVLFMEGEPAYEAIYEGEWGDEAPYICIHRLGSNGKVKGVLPAVLDYAERFCPYLRIDTHEENHFLQERLLQQGFHYRGKVFLPGAGERLAYDRLAKGVRSNFGGSFSPLSVTFSVVGKK